MNGNEAIELLQIERFADFSVIAVLGGGTEGEADHQNASALEQVAPGHGQ
jgi:hypothetical protein